MKKLSPYIFLVLIFFNTTVKAHHAYRIWTVTEFLGEAWYVEPNKVIGQTQSFYKGYSEGVFFNCDYKGLSYTHNKYTLEEFLNNKEFELFKKLKEELKFKDEEVFVNRITCNGDNNPDKRGVFYPFVTIEPGNKAYYLYEGGIFVLELK
jgi:hypothetical protein|tara:strand:+ start:33 stop:482 length:450 start_codon:yes stop_codon:yes gene_type:complete